MTAIVSMFLYNIIYYYILKMYNIFQFKCCQWSIYRSVPPLNIADFVTEFTN